MATKSDDTVWAWGANDKGQIGKGTSGLEDKPAPVQVKDPSGENFLSGATDVSAGGHWSLAVKSDGGTVWGWGQNGGNNQLGDGTGTGTSRYRLRTPTITPATLQT